MRGIIIRILHLNHISHIRVLFFMLVKLNCVFFSFQEKFCNLPWKFRRICKPIQTLDSIQFKYDIRLFICFCFLLLLHSCVWTIFRSYCGKFANISLSFSYCLSLLYTYTNICVGIMPPKWLNRWFSHSPNEAIGRRRTVHSDTFMSAWPLYSEIKRNTSEI